MTAAGTAQDAELTPAVAQVIAGLIAMQFGIAQAIAGDQANQVVPNSGDAQIVAGLATILQGLAVFAAGVDAVLRRLAELAAEDDDTDTDDHTDDEDDGGGGPGGGHLGAQFGFSMATLNAAQNGLNNLQNGFAADGYNLPAGAPAA